jgi:hypothetical protein
MFDFYQYLSTRKLSRLRALKIIRQFNLFRIRHSLTPNPVLTAHYPLPNSQQSIHTPAFTIPFLCALQNNQESTSILSSAIENRVLSPLPQFPPPSCRLNPYLPLAAHPTNRPLSSYYPPSLHKSSTLPTPRPSLAPLYQIANLSNTDYGYALS